jgi:hypothetical protein
VSAISPGEDLMARLAVPLPFVTLRRHIRCMGVTIYCITRQADSTFTVEIIGPGPLHRGASGFTTEAEAEAWVSEKKRMAPADEEWERRAPRV